MPGLGQARLGYWRRAVVWASAPMFVNLAFFLLVMRLQLRPAYGLVVPFVICVWIVARLLAIREVLSLPERASGRSGPGRLLLFLLGMLIFAFALSAFEGLHVASHVAIRSSAMQPTLLEQELAMVDPSAYRSRLPKRGELVVFGAPAQRRVKRMIGLPGDRVEVVDGAVVINGWEAPRCEVGLVTWSPSKTGILYVEFLGDSAYLTFWNRMQDSAPRAFVPAAGQAVLIGDDRNNSEELHAGIAGDDSGVPLELIEGRPAFLFLGLSYNGDYDWPRYGSALDAPQLPVDLKNLEPQFRNCLALHPPRAETEPRGVERPAVQH